MKGIYEYLDGTIKDPIAVITSPTFSQTTTTSTIYTQSSITSILLLSDKTMWNSLNSSAAE